MPPRARATAQPEPADPPDRGGWFRNTSDSPLTVLGPDATTVLGPGRVARLECAPGHRDLAPVTEADLAAQDAADAQAATQAHDDEQPDNREPEA